MLRLLPAFRANDARLVVFSNPPGAFCAVHLEAGDTVDLRRFVLSTEAWTAVEAECGAVILHYLRPAGKLWRPSAAGLEAGAAAFEMVRIEVESPRQLEAAEEGGGGRG